MVKGKVKGKMLAILKLLAGVICGGFIGYVVGDSATEGTSKISLLLALA